MIEEKEGDSPAATTSESSSTSLKESKEDILNTNCCVSHGKPPQRQQKCRAAHATAAITTNNSRRLLRPLIITINKHRQDILQEMFTSSPFSHYFEKPTFSLGVPSRTLRTQYGLLSTAFKAGLVSQEEYNIFMLERHNKVASSSSSMCEKTAASNAANTGCVIPKELKDAIGTPWEHVAIGYCNAQAAINANDNTVATVMTNKKQDINKHSEIDFTNCDNQLNCIKTSLESTKESHQQPLEKVHNVNGDNDDDNSSKTHPRRHPAPYSCYSSELWHKAKTLNRDRAVLACTMAHLIAMKTFVTANTSAAATKETNITTDGKDEKKENEKQFCDDNDDHDLQQQLPYYDVILEDNVRPIVSTGATKVNGDEDCKSNEHVCECARRMWGTMAADNDHNYDLNCEHTLNSQTPSSSSTHLRYYGYLGSVRNLAWVIGKHAPRTASWCNSVFNECTFIGPLSNNDTGNRTNNRYGTFPYPTSEEHYGIDNEVNVGGTAIWGAYAYWISREGYSTLLRRLRSDVGSLLWKGKRMRNYIAKPIDKIMPRVILSATVAIDEESQNVERRTRRERMRVSVATHPAFFRAPMLTSSIHSKWDKEFCKSTEYQLEHPIHYTSAVAPKIGYKDIHEKEVPSDASAIHTSWDNLLLTNDEKKVVSSRRKTGDWQTIQLIDEAKKIS